MSTCNQLNLQTQGSQPVISKNLPNHWVRVNIDPYKFVSYSSQFKFIILCYGMVSSVTYLVCEGPKLDV